MDTAILLFIVFGLIIWLDAKRRRNSIKNTWDELHNQTAANKWVERKTIPVPDDPIELKFMNAPETQDIDEDEDDIIIKEAVKEVMEQKVDTSDAESALRRLGYKQKDINKVIKVITEEALSGGNSTADIITKALAILNA